MAKHKYAVDNKNKEHSSKAVGRSLPISTKHSVEICRCIRNKPIERAKNILKDAISKKKPIPFKRFKTISHKPGKMASGRYPVKASKEILQLVESAEANAQFKGLNVSNLIVSHICAHKASTPYHYGRQKRRKMKRTNVEILLEERSEEKKEKKTNKEMPKDNDHKQEAKKQKNPNKQEENKK